MSNRLITLQRISAAIAHDYKAVRLAALQDTPTAFGSTFARESLLTDDEWIKRANILDGEKAIGFLARDDKANQYCGIVACFLFEQDDSRALLVSMWVAPDDRRFGVGEMLVKAIIDWTRSRSVQALYLTVTNNNDGAIAFYKRMGFSMTGRTEPYPNDPALFEYEMVMFFNNDANE